jgi:CheY-like chemotaxis protein
VALSANVLDSDVAQCVEAGMDGHLGKPLRSDSIAQLRRYITAAAVTNHHSSTGQPLSLAPAGS